MGERMVLVKNMIDSRVGVSDPTTGIRRRWEKRGQTVPIPYSAMEQLLWQDGFRRMIDQGYLYIESMKDKQDLGLEPIEATQPTNIIALSPVQMSDMLRNKPIDVFKRELSGLPDAQIDNLIDYAISQKIMDSQKCSILKQVTGRDIIKAISRKEEIESEEKAEKERKIKMAAEGRRIG
jgi:hypothetical protein